jgi:hypothetical protein
MPDFARKNETPSPFSDFTEPDQVTTKVFDSPDPRFESPRKIGKRTIQVMCPDCGTSIEVEVANYDMKCGQKSFAKEVGTD